MALVKVGAKHRVVIPKDIRTRMRVKPGDYLEIRCEGSQAVMKRKKVVDEFPYTDEPIGPKTRAMLRQALKEVQEGKLIGPFRTATEVQAHLDSLKRQR